MAAVGPRFGADQLPAEKLSDEELRSALAHYRKKRLATKVQRAADSTPPATGHAIQLDASRARQYYANLELKEGATLDDVRRSYRRLLERYAPDRHKDDPKKLALAKQLGERLTEAYRALVTHLS